MKLLFFAILLSVSQLVLSQNKSYQLIRDKVNPLIEQKDYESAKKQWIEIDRIYRIDPQERFLFIIESLKNEDVKYFKANIKRLIKENGYHYFAADTFPENLSTINHLFLEKKIFPWLIRTSERNYPKWAKRNYESIFISKKVDELVTIDQVDYYLSPKDLIEGLSEKGLNKYKTYVEEQDLENIRALTMICIRNNGIPNHFENGAGIFYKLQLIVWHNLKTENNREQTWKFILPWVDKAYFEGKIDYSLYEAYDYWLHQHTGFQYYGFIPNAPVQDSIKFKDIKEKYNF